MNSKADILIAGGGPVGHAAAVEKTWRDFAPVTIDDDDEQTGQSRALAIRPAQSPDRVDRT